MRACALRSPHEDGEANRKGGRYEWPRGKDPSEKKHIGFIETLQHYSEILREHLLSKIRGPIAADVGNKLPNLGKI